MCSSWFIAEPKSLLSFWSGGSREAGLPLPNICETCLDDQGSQMPEEAEVSSSGISIPQRLKASKSGLQPSLSASATAPSLMESV